MTVEKRHTLTDTQIDFWTLSLSRNASYQPKVKPFQLPTALLSLNEKMNRTTIGA